MNHNIQKTDGARNGEHRFYAVREQEEEHKLAKIIFIG